MFGATPDGFAYVNRRRSPLFVSEPHLNGIACNYLVVVPNGLDSFEFGEQYNRRYTKNIIIDKLLVKIPSPREQRRPQQPFYLPFITSARRMGDAHHLVGRPAARPFVELSHTFAYKYLRLV